MGWDLGTIKGRYTAVFLGFIVAVCVLTVIGIQLWVKPELQRAGEQNLVLRVSEIATDIRDQLNGVQSQSRSITQLVAQLPSEQIDAVLPALIQSIWQCHGVWWWHLADAGAAGSRSHQVQYLLSSGWCQQADPQHLLELGRGAQLFRAALAQSRAAGGERHVCLGGGLQGWCQSATANQLRHGDLS